MADEEKTAVDNTSAQPETNSGKVHYYLVLTDKKIFKKEKLQKMFVKAVPSA